MLNLPQKTLDTIKKYLLKQQREVEKNLKAVEQDDPLTAPSVAESSEPGTDSFLAEAHGRTMALGGELKGLGVSIKKALLKMRRGTYGKCEKCGKQIEVNRLIAMPTAEYCLSCSVKKIKK